MRDSHVEVWGGGASAEVDATGVLESLMVSASD